MTAKIHKSFVTNETRELFVGKPASVDSTNSDIYVLKDLKESELEKLENKILIPEIFYSMSINNVKIRPFRSH